MARLARLVLPEVPHHVVHRGNRRQDLFFSDADREVYRLLLAEHLAQAACRLSAYCWMTNHVHLLVVPGRNKMGTGTISFPSGRFSAGGVFRLVTG